jgi:hypothetical protein
MRFEGENNLLFHMEKIETGLTDSREKLETWRAGRELGFDVVHRFQRVATLDAAARRSGVGVEGLT